jgi:hypothetical protein
MALIFADDFQQWNSSISTGLKASGLYQQYLGQDVPGYLNEATALGIYPPHYVQGYGGANSILFSLYYDTTKGALACCHPRAPNEGGAANASGYRRLFNYEGDTLYFGATLEMGGTTNVYNGDFLFFGNAPDPNAFTGTDFVGTNYLYSVGIDASGFYTFNGVSTTVQAYYKPATVQVYFDCVFGPDYMELWINNVMCLRQSRQNIALKEFAISASRLITITNTNFCIFVHSVIIADNTDGFAQRIGRKRVKTEPVLTVPVQESTLQGSGAPATVLTRYASGPTTDSDGQMLGCLVSPLPFVKNDFGSTRSSTKKPYAAAVNLQVKRLFPAADGLAVHPYVTIAGTKTFGNKVRPSSTWKEYSTEVPIAPGQTFTAFNFGYEHDYKDLNKVFIVDRQNTEVYGDVNAIPDGWAKSTDLIAYDSSRFNASGFADYNSKFMALLSDTATLPYKAGQTFRYGEGIHLGEGGGIYAAVGVVPQTTWSSPWTLDFWAKETVDNVISSLWYLCTPAPVNLNDRILIGVHDASTTKMALWNNTTNARVISAWNAPLSSTAWRHWAFVFNGTKTSVYVNGTLVGTLDFAIGQFTARPGIQNRTLGTTARAIIERYRLRSGAVWASNFDPETIYN